MSLSQIGAVRPETFEALETELKDLIAKIEAKIAANGLPDISLELLGQINAFLDKGNKEKGEYRQLFLNNENYFKKLLIALSNSEVFGFGNIQICLGENFRYMAYGGKPVVAFSSVVCEFTPSSTIPQSTALVKALATMRTLPTLMLSALRRGERIRLVLTEA